MDDAFGQLGFDNISTGCYVRRPIRFGGNMKIPFTQIILQSREGQGKSPFFSLTFLIMDVP